MGKFGAALVFAVLFPYIVTLAWTGTVEGTGVRTEAGGDRRILLDEGNVKAYMSMEEFLPGALAAQIPADFGEEALKAQAIIARTYICGRMGEEKEISQSELDMDYLDGKELAALWGEQAAKNYRRLREAAEETRGQVITYEGELIEPLFHRASAGRTREGGDGYPYLTAADCPGDLEADGSLQAVTMTKEELAEKIRTIPGAGEVAAEGLPGDIQILAADETGYVKEIQIGTGSCTGEEVQRALGLASPCFSVEEYGDGLRVVTRGIGHGYGLSQYTASLLSGEGRTAEEILQFFYKSIVLISV